MNHQTTFTGRQLSIKISCFLLIVLLASIALKLNAQDFNEEFRRRLRQEMIQPEIRPLPQQQQPTFNRPLPQQQQQQEILRVSPTTRLPTRYDRIQTIHQPEQFRVNINLNYTNEDRSQVARSRIDYATGSFNPIPDSRSIAQQAQNGIGASRGIGGGSINVGTLDPVRAINNRRAGRRAARLDTILREFEVITFVGREEPAINEEEEEN
jgi:hypothetical protein